ncbi:MAG: U32 family peptidase [Ruminococcaceae bacterium]|nr:U32 family peptidase [Oscillospiraceae bacterium]
MVKAELLAPAGDFECLKSAVRFGADAVYIGGPFMQLRAAASAFSEENIKAAADFCHRNGRKLYVTVNSFAKNSEIPLLRDYARRLNALGADAAIVSDIGAVSAMKEACPELPIHISTQANCMNYAAAMVYYNMGASRIVLAREMKLEDIALLRENTPKELELEAFVHGAMCMSYSGRCLLSAYLTNRSGNRGDCDQSCRWMYHLCEEKRPGEFFPIEEDEHGTAILSSQDLNCMRFVEDLQKAGISSLKIEGRMKSPYYVATVVNAYRKRLDGGAPTEVLERELHSISHRPYSSGFYFGNMSEFRPDNGVYIRDCTFVAAVLADESGGRVKIEQRNLFKEGDTLEVLRPEAVGESFTASGITTEAGESTDRANRAKDIYVIDCPIHLHAGDMLRTRSREYETRKNG